MLWSYRTVGVRFSIAQRRAIMLRGARSRCPFNGKDNEVSPQEETLEILRNFLDCVSRAKLSDRRWEHICSRTTQMAERLNRSIPIPKRKGTSRRGPRNGIKGLTSLCLETERKINRVKDLPPDQRLTLLGYLQEIRQEVLAI